jgi:hypothetical protein
VKKLVRLLWLAPILAGSFAAQGAPARATLCPPVYYECYCAGEFVGCVRSEDRCLQICSQ